MFTKSLIYILLPGLPKTSELQHGQHHIISESGDIKIEQRTRDYDWTPFLNPERNTSLAALLREHKATLTLVGIHREAAASPDTTSSSFSQDVPTRYRDGKVIPFSSRESDFLANNTMPVPVPEAVYEEMVQYFKQVQWQDRHQTSGTFETSEDWLRATAAAFEGTRLMVECIREDLEQKKKLGLYAGETVRIIVSDHFGVTSHYWINEGLKKDGYPVVTLHAEQIMPGYFQFSEAMEAWHQKNKRMVHPRFLEPHLLRSADVHTCLSPEHMLDAVRMSQLAAEHAHQAWQEQIETGVLAELQRPVPLGESQPPIKVEWQGASTICTHIPAGIDVKEWSSYRSDEEVIAQSAAFKANLAQKGWDTKTALVTFGRLDQCKYIPEFKWQYLKAMVHAWREHGLLLHRTVGIVEKNSAPDVSLESGRALYDANQSINRLIETVALYLDSRTASREDSFIDIVANASAYNEIHPLGAEQALISLGDERWSHDKLAAIVLALKGRSIFVIAGREGFNLTGSQAVVVSDGHIGIMAHAPGIVHYLDERYIPIRYGDYDPEASILAEKGLADSSLVRFARASAKTVNDLSLLATMPGEQFYRTVVHGQSPRGLTHSAQDANMLAVRARKSGEAVLDLTRTWTGDKWWAQNVALLLNAEPSAAVEHPESLHALVAEIYEKLSSKATKSLETWGLDKDGSMLQYMVASGRV